MHPLPVTHSVLSAEALACYAVEHYKFEQPCDCRLLRRGVNDSYLLETPGDRHILRVYRANWRPLADIMFELDLLLHLQDQGVAVSVPVIDSAGRYVHPFSAPEGTRYAALFSYAPGDKLMRRTWESRVYGQAVAVIHNASDGFVHRCTRPSLDFEHLISQPLAAVHPLMRHRTSDVSFLNCLAGAVGKRLNNLVDEGLTQGICHGDTHGWNAHINEGGAITFFDFDCCGPGWPAYDVAVFRWNSERSKNPHLNYQLFLDGYEEVRHQEGADLQSIPALVAARQIWMMGLQATNAPDWGFGRLDDEYFDEAIHFLTEWVHLHPDLQQ